jgi:hypothetical protein
MACSIGKNDFSLLSVTLNTVLVFNIRMEVGITSLAMTGNGKDLGGKSALINHAVLSISFIINWSWMGIVWASFTGSSHQKFFNFVVARIFDASLGLRVWMSPRIAIDASVWSIILQDLSSFAFDRNADCVSWIRFSPCSTSEAVTVFQFDLSGSIAIVSHAVSGEFAIFIIWSIIGSASLLVTPLLKVVNTVSAFIRSAASE